MALSRQEREELVLDLYFNQNKNYRQIAEEARMCPRDIGQIVNKASKDKERQQNKSVQVQAYDLFSNGKTPIQVATMLNIGQIQVTEYYTEYLRLVQLENVVQIYQELGNNIGYFVNLYKEAKSAKMGIPQVINLLKIANNDLPSAQYKYEQLLKEISILESKKKSLNEELGFVTEQIISTRKTFDFIKLDCENETARFLHLQQQTAKQQTIVKELENNNNETCDKHLLYQKRMKQEALVKQFENDNEMHNNIRKYWFWLDNITKRTLFFIIPLALVIYVPKYSWHM